MFYILSYLPVTRTKGRCCLFRVLDPNDQCAECVLYYCTIVLYLLFEIVVLLEQPSERAPKFRGNIFFPS